MIRSLARLLSFCALLLVAGTLSAHDQQHGTRHSEISSVSVSAETFNPSRSQVVRIRFRTERGGLANVTVVDRDGVPVRLLSQRAGTGGMHELRWDGRDDSGLVVPDEAYSLKIDFRSSLGPSSYFPAAVVADMQPVFASYYARTEGVLAYRLDRPSRVHIQAGSATRNAATNEMNGPVLKTIVNRSPRASGAVVESWRGFDESGTIYVPDLPRFVIAIAATPLPDNSVIAYGNRSLAFLAYASKRKGHSLIEQPAGRHHHHAGLTVFDDISPSASLEPSRGEWNAGAGEWSIRNGSALRMTLSGETAPMFAKQPGRIAVFVDGREVASMTPDGSKEATLRLPNVSPGTHIIAANWISEYGPVAAASARVNITREGGNGPVRGER